MCFAVPALNILGLDKRSSSGARTKKKKQPKSSSTTTSKIRKRFKDLAELNTDSTVEGDGVESSTDSTVDSGYANKISAAHDFDSTLKPGTFDDSFMFDSAVMGEKASVAPSLEVFVMLL